ncbi:hypothetical protein FOA52_000987 [Chlamydomonas sp. UWO 241]|nr:hypothetical protein FOA52_000987 [Chlamydomonas sp. UWO 241]
MVDQVDSAVFGFRSRFLSARSELDLCTTEPEAAAAKFLVAYYGWLGIPESMLTLLKDLERACVLLLPRMQQLSDRARGAWHLLTAITSLGAVVLDSNIDAIKMPEYFRKLKERCQALQSKAKAKADAEADAKAAETAAETAKEGSRKEIKKAKAELEAMAKTRAKAAARTKAEEEGSNVRKLTESEKRYHEEHVILLQLEQFQHIGGVGAAALNLVAEACAVVLAPLQSQQKRGLAALLLLQKLESTDVLELMARAGDWIWVLLEASAPLLKQDAALNATQPDCKVEDAVPQAEQAAAPAKHRKQHVNEHEDTMARQQKAMVCTTDDAAKLLVQLDMPPDKHPALMLPRLLVRVAQEMTIVCSSIAIAVAQPEQQVEQHQQQSQQQQHTRRLPPRYLPTMTSGLDGSSQTFGSPVGSLGASTSNRPGTSSSGGGASGECRRQQSSDGCALLVATAGDTSSEAPAALEDHDLSNAGSVLAPHQAASPQPQRKPNAQNRLLGSLNAAALRGEFAVTEAIEAMSKATGEPVRRVRVGAATKGGLGIARYRPLLRRVCPAAAPPPPQQQQLARSAVDGALPGDIAALEDAHRECRALLGAVAEVVDVLVKSPEFSEAMHGIGGSSVFVEEPPRLPNGLGHDSGEVVFLRGRMAATSVVAGGTAAVAAR